MNFINIFIAICGCTLAVQSQSTPSQNQYQRNNVPINSDQIYFLDDSRQLNRNGPTLTQNSSRGNIAQQNGAVDQTTRRQDSYLQQFAPLTPNNQNNRDLAYEQQLSIELQPPPFNKNADSVYDANMANINNFNDQKGSQLNRDEQMPVRERPVEFSNASLAMTAFGLNLLKNVDTQAKNVVISPYSIANVLAVLQQGALGATQQQIAVALQMTPDMSVDAFRKVTEDFQKRSSRNILRVANNIYVADAFDLNPAFKAVASRYFGSEVTPIRFAQSQDAAQKINNWVASKTNNKIQNLLAPDAVGENTQLVLVNAVYFKGLWQVRFKPESTSPREFHLNEKETKTVPFMRMRRIFKTGVDRSNNVQVIILPFENMQYSLMVILPSEITSLNSVIQSMTASKLAEYHHFTPKEVDLELPKFAVRADTELNQILRKLGIINIFSAQSELSGLGTYRTFSPQVSSAVHTAMLSVDEDGGTAAAATAFVVVALSYDDPSVTFKANRPFIAVLWDNKFALPMFMAKVGDPTA